MKIYILKGSSGICEGFSHWEVAAYKSKEKAEVRADILLSECAADNAKNVNNHGYDWPKDFFVTEMELED